ncbi:MAG: hypothetical protein D6788_02915 [Planctomycetota bacterium]|nr:MAG: hypothetical protein D6788_02915 [Planctomycetota bacterium]
MRGRGIGVLLGIWVGWAWIGVRPVVAQEASAPQIAVQIDGEYGPHLPPPVYGDDYGKRVDLLINVMHVFMIVLFVGWAIFFVYCLVRFRARPGQRAPAKLIKASITKYLETGVAVFEACLLIGLSIPVWAEVKQEFPSEKENPVHVRVVAEQFMWNFHYPGPDGKFGKRAPQFVDPAANPLGIDPNDPNGADDIVSGELHFPMQRPVIAEITSKDVIHSFFIPVLRIKQDAIPGMRVPIWFRAGKTGNYEVACAQLCGNNHYSMRALMTVHESEEAFEKWLESQKPEEFDEDEFDD